METLAINPVLAGFSLSIRGRQVTADLAPFIESISYTDNLGAQADTLDIVLDNSSGIWLNDWYPEHGDTLECSLGLAHLTNPPLTCGLFEIDELEASNDNGELFVIRALATGTEKALRSKNNKSFHQTTLNAVIAYIATQHNLTLVGDIEVLAISHITQHQETDLEFLTRISREYGYYFNVKGQQLIFVKYADLSGQTAVMSIHKNKDTRYNLRESVKSVTTTARLEYDNIKQGKKHRSKVTQLGRASADELVVYTKTDDPKVAKTQAAAALDNHNEDRLTAEISLPGDYRYVAGNVVHLPFLGKRAGDYLIKQASHRVDRSSGWTATLLCQGNLQDE